MNQVVATGEPGEPNGTEAGRGGPRDRPFSAASFRAAIGEARRVLLTGCGGGCDVFSTIPLAMRLRSEGIEVHLASYTFSLMDDLAAEATGPAGWWQVRPAPPNPIMEVDPYQPERHLTRWLSRTGEPDPVVWCLERTGIVPAVAAWRWLADHLEVDAIVAVDGGTDSLMTGIEAGLGTPVEDVTTMLGVVATDVPTQLLVSIGFGVDSFHGVAHVDVLESVAAIDAAGGFWGVDHLSHRSAEGIAFGELVEAANAAMPGCESIVASSVAAAVAARFGNVALGGLGGRTAGSELFINPLMAMYWTFDLAAVTDRIAYREHIARSTSHGETMGRIQSWRSTITTRPRRRLPM